MRLGAMGTIKRPQRAFDLLSYEEQVNELEKAKSVIEPIAGRITSFRVPALLVNQEYGQERFWETRISNGMVRVATQEV